MRMDHDIRVDFERFNASLEHSAKIGVGRENGLARLALTDADKQMRDDFVRWCREAGLQVKVDSVGNIFGRRPGRNNDLPPVLLGSHLDTQQNGGRFDGIVGVLGALEVVRRLNDLELETQRPIEIVNWTNEEGARFSPPMLASGCFADVYDVAWAHARIADDGPTFGNELKRIGYLGDEAVGGRPIDTYLELHIEQGSILDTEKVQVGIVTGGYSSLGARIQFEGETAHTGPWPMQRRRNALVAGARLLAEVDDIGWEFAGTGGKATASHLAAWPNKPGIISDWAEAVCDVRHNDPATLEVMAARMLRAVGAAASRSGCDYRILDTWNWGGDIFNPELIGSVRHMTAALGYSARDLQSQAGHDAYFLARVCPTAMIFTPCQGGITHNNREFASSEDLTPGLNVLLHVAYERANR